MPNGHGGVPVLGAPVFFAGKREPSSRVRIETARKLGMARPRQRQVSAGWLGRIGRPGTRAKCRTLERAIAGLSEAQAARRRSMSAGVARTRNTTTSSR